MKKFPRLYRKHKKMCSIFCTRLFFFSFWIPTMLQDLLTASATKNEKYSNEMVFSYRKENLFLKLLTLNPISSKSILFIYSSLWQDFRFSISFHSFAPFLALFFVHVYYGGFKWGEREREYQEGDVDDGVESWNKWVIRLGFCQTYLDVIA